MGSTSSNSPKPGSFPAGLRVLVVDDDSAWLTILEKMLKKCNYEVATCNLAQEALDMLRERKDGFDIVISDVNMPDMDGFKFLEHVGLKMDLPVIMMSVDGETSRVMKGVQHGACDYLLKPIRLKELRNIWQHVFRKRINEVRSIEGQESLDEIQKMRNGTEQSDDGNLFNGENGDVISGKKRKEFDNKNNDRECGDSSSVKKARVVWTVDLHQKFVKAVNRIGFDKVGPKKILDLMGVPWLTRENVASHLQKYRLYLSRLQKENELKAASGGIKPSDISSKDVCLQSAVNQNSVTMQQNIVINEYHSVPGHKIQIHNHGSSICEGNVSGILSMPMAAEMLNSEAISESKTQAHYTWSAGVPSLQLKQELKPHFQSEHRFDHFPLHVPSQIQVDFVSHNSGSEAADKPTEANVGPSLLSVQPQRHSTNCHTLDQVPCSMWSTKNHNVEENLSLKNIIVGTGSALRLRDVEFNDYSSPGDFYPVNPHIVNLESFGYSNQELIADVRSQLYDSESFDGEYSSDPVDLVINQGLYFA